MPEVAGHVTLLDVTFFNENLKRKVWGDRTKTSAAASVRLHSVNRAGQLYPAMDLSGILMQIENGNDEEIEKRLQEYNAEVGFWNMLAAC